MEKAWKNIILRVDFDNFGFKIVSEKEWSNDWWLLVENNVIENWKGKSKTERFEAEKP